MRVVIVQNWTETERGWGQRPDGVTVHLSRADRDRYVQAYWDSQPEGPAPDEYSYPSGEPRAVDLPENHEVIRELVEKNSIGKWYPRVPS